MNYRANIVIFHEIAPLSARSSKKEDAKRGTAAREMAKIDRKTGGIRGCNSWHLLFRRPPTAHLPKRASAREASGKRGGPSRVTKRRNCRAAPALVRTTSFRPKKGGANGSSLGHFFDLSGSFSPIAPTAFDTHADARSKGGETGEKALSRTRAQHRVSVFCLHASTIIRWFTTRYG